MEKAPFVNIKPRRKFCPPVAVAVDVQSLKFATCKEYISLRYIYYLLGAVAMELSLRSPYTKTSTSPATSN